MKCKRCKQGPLYADEAITALCTKCVDNDRKFDEYIEAQLNERSPFVS